MQKGHKCTCAAAIQVVVCQKAEEFVPPTPSPVATTVTETPSG